MDNRRFMTKDTTTRIKNDGLRYASKVGGSPFLGRGNTRSCFKCGRHRPADQLHSQRLLGKVQRVCKPACEPRHEGEAAPAP
jgi:hypothetical protein